MIVCSCNVFSDVQIRTVVANTGRRPQTSKVYASLGCAAKCGRCAHTINAIINETCAASDACVGARSVRH